MGACRDVLPVIGRRTDVAAPLFEGKPPIVSVLDGLGSPGFTVRDIGELRR